MNIGRSRGRRRCASVVYRTRGLYLLLALGLVVWLKHQTGSSVPLPLYLVLAALAGGAQVFRTWAAGFVGSTARAGGPGAEELFTAGPFGYVRNPMYLGNLVIVTALAAMSGLWFALPLVWAAYVFVYAIVIPLEERYMEGKFGAGYETYRDKVPMFIPRLRPLGSGSGTFRLNAALANESVAWPVLALLVMLFHLL